MLEAAHERTVEDIVALTEIPAPPLSATMHRAFDMVADAGAALEALIRCGVDRVLTSGQAPTALAALPRLPSGKVDLARLRVGGV